MWQLSADLAICSNATVNHVCVHIRIQGNQENVVKVLKAAQKAQEHQVIPVAQKGTCNDNNSVRKISILIISILK